MLLLRANYPDVYAALSADGRHAPTTGSCHIAAPR